MTRPIAAKTYDMAMQFNHAVNAELKNGRSETKLRVSGDNVQFGKTPRKLLGVEIGKSDALKEVRTRMYLFAATFESNLAWPDSHRATQSVRDAAVELSAVVDHAVRTGGDVTSGDCKPLNEAIRQAIDPQRPSDFS